MSILRLEAFLQKHIEGFFNRKFGTRLEQSEVMKQLERELLGRRKKGRNGIFLPNDFLIAFNPEDYQRLCARKFLDDMYIVIKKLIISHDAFMENDLLLKVEQDKGLVSGDCRVQGKFSQNEIKPLAGEVMEGHTVVLDRSAFKPPMNLPNEHKFVSLLALEGPDADSYLEFGEKQIYIGRRINNDFILTDSNSSRVHAYIAYENSRHILYDADSLNGTFVNGKEVVSPQVLRFGDEIMIGETILLYEVI